MPLASIASSHCGLLAGHIIFGKIIVSSSGTAVLCGATSVPLFCFLLITIKNQCYNNNLRLITIIIGGAPYHPPMGPLPGPGLSRVALSLHS
jgi:hypothetical protein